MPTRCYEITDEQWQRIEHLLPGKATDPGATAKDNRLFINGVLWIGRSGAPWRDLPERYGNWNSVARRFSRWAERGRWEALFAAMQERTSSGSCSTPRRSGRTSMPPAKKTTADAEALGRSRGGLTTKVHAACDALGNPLRFLLGSHRRAVGRPGQRSEITQAEPLLSGVEPEAVIADKAYDADWLIEQIDLSGAAAVIPSKRHRLEQREIDRNLYADRNKVERLFNRLKHYRRVATRYEKTARNYLAFIHVAATMVLLL